MQPQLNDTAMSSMALCAPLCDGASPVLVLYDYFITFTEEVDYIWRRKFSAVSVLFLLMRYCVLASKIIWIADFLFGISGEVRLR